LRKGLNAADTAAYPETIYGKAGKSNIERYLRVAEAHRDHGAIQGDPEKATGGGMKNRQRDNYNDVGWNILPGNCYRYLEQIDADQTSVGWWHAGPKESIYGRFARGFDPEAGKAEMFFRLDGEFFEDSRAAHRVELTVTYLDRGHGQWSLCYNNGTSKTTARAVRCQDSGNWKTTALHLDDAHFNGSLERGGDLTIRHLDGEPALFHMLGLERGQP